MEVTMTLERNRESLVHKIMSIDSDELIESIAKYVNSQLKIIKLCILPQELIFL